MTPRTALVFAAGLGTRLRPLTDKMPKALVPVAGKPLLGHVLDRLAGAGFTDIVMNVHHFPDQIIDYLQTREQPGIRIRVSDERDLLRDTGGGVKYAHKLLGDSPFLIHNTDILSNLDLRSIPLREEALATLVVSPRESSRYLLFDDGMRLVGWTHTITGEVRSPYPGLDPARCRKLAFSGIHLQNPGVFDAFDALGFGDVFPIMDFYLKACRDYPIYGFVPDALRLLDVGKLSTLDQAERFLQEI